MGGAVAEEGFDAAAARGVHDDHLDDLLALDERVQGRERGQDARQDGQGVDAGEGRGRGAEEALGGGGQLVRLEPVVN